MNGARVWHHDCHVKLDGEVCSADSGCVSQKCLGHCCGDKGKQPGCTKCESAADSVMNRPDKEEVILGNCLSCDANYYLSSGQCVQCEVHTVPTLAGSVIDCNAYRCKSPCKKLPAVGETCISDVECTSEKCLGKCCASKYFGFHTQGCGACDVNDPKAFKHRWANEFKSDDGGGMFLQFFFRDSLIVLLFFFDTILSLLLFLCRLCVMCC